MRVSLLALLGVVACSGSSGPSEPPSLPAGDAERPDVLLISVDTLRPDHLGAWGYERDTSPFLDTLAASGTRFANAWAPAPWTLPSHATMLSGQSPDHHGAIEGELTLPPALPLLQSTFQDAGYTTLGTVTTLFVSDRFGFDRGFSHYHDFGIDDEKKNLSQTPDAEEAVDHVLQTLSTLPPGEPVFSFLHLYDAHYPYAAPGEWEEKFDRKGNKDDIPYRNYQTHLRKQLSAAQMDHQVAQYDEEIAYVDHQLRRLVEAWRASGRSLTVVLAADHGEEFGERGSWGHAHTLTPEQLHVPWLIDGPGVKAQVVEERVGLEDLSSTVAGLAGLSHPGDGVDRSAQVREGAAVPTQHTPGDYAETSRFRTLKLRWHSPPWDLYWDLPSDTLEACDLSKDATCEFLEAPPEEVATRLKAELLARVGTPWTAKRGVVMQSSGVFVVDGKRFKKQVAVPAGQGFALLPPDASFTVKATDGASDGPFSALGELPGEDALVAYSGQLAQAGAVELDDNERAALEALGYVQGEE